MFIARAGDDAEFDVGIVVGIIDRSKIWRRNDSLYLQI